MALNIWVVGNGAREQAIKTACEKSKLSKSVKLIEENCLELLSEVSQIPDLVILGPEQPICDGLVDEFTARGIKCIGVNKKFSQLESSKLFAKKFIVNHGIKCAKLLPIESNDFPQVMKFDGLCKGKGVKVLYNNDEKNVFARKFTGMRYFIEEYLEGEEISVMSYLYNGRLINFRPARDFKRLSAAKDAPNTGGMGAYTPVNLTDEQQIKLQIYLEKLVKSLLTEGADFNGFIYSGLIWTRGDWYVLEYNVRLGDPECQAVLSLLDSDLMDILEACVDGTLDQLDIQWKDQAACCLVLASGGYPLSYQKGYPISGLTEAGETATVFHAGTARKDGQIVTSGGRVLGVTALGKDLDGAIDNAYAAASHISFTDMHFRTDIGRVKFN